MGYPFIIFFQSYNKIFFYGDALYMGAAASPLPPYITLIYNFIPFLQCSHLLIMNNNCNYSLIFVSRAIAVPWRTLRTADQFNNQFY